jgi:putative ABC transport system ATP-binding protein
MAEVKQPTAEPVKAIATGLRNGSVQPMVKIRGLNQYFGKGENRKQVLVDNSITLMPGELVIMTGPSGSGKTPF